MQHMHFYLRPLIQKQCLILSQNVPLAKLAKKCRQERESSEDEDDIPLMKNV